MIQKKKTHPLWSKNNTKQYNQNNFKLLFLPVKINPRNSVKGVMANEHTIRPTLASNPELMTQTLGLKILTSRPVDNPVNIKKKKKKIYNKYHMWFNVNCFIRIKKAIPFLMISTVTAN